MDQKYVRTDEFVKGIFTHMVRGARVINFTTERTPEAIIAIDEDPYGDQVAALRYEEVAIVGTGTGTWIVALGTAFGSYPKNSYLNAITAIPVVSAPDTEERVAVYKKLAKSTYFRNALIIAMSNNTVVSPSKNCGVCALRSIFWSAGSTCGNRKNLLPYGKYNYSVVGDAGTYPPDLAERVGDYFLERLAGRRS